MRFRGSWGTRAWAKAATCALALAATIAAPAHAACHFGQLGTFPAKVEDGRVIVRADLDGKTVEMVLDTGSPFTSLSASAVRLLGLRAHPADTGLSIGGAPARVVDINGLDFDHFALRHVTAVVVDKAERDGQIGRDLLGDYDVEVDLAHNAVRLLRLSGCSDAQMVYWGGKGFAEAPLQGYASSLDDYRTALGLNGHKVMALLDTGAPETTVSREAAQAAGVASEAPNGQAVFETVSLGDETVRNARLQVTGLGRYGSFYSSDRPDDRTASYAVIGGDFFRSHRVLISPSHHMVYFTYLGGPIFQAPPSPAASR